MALTSMTSMARAGWKHTATRETQPIRTDFFRSQIAMLFGGLSALDFEKIKVATYTRRARIRDAEQTEQTAPIYGPRR